MKEKSNYRPLIVTPTEIEHYIRYIITPCTIDVLSFPLTLQLFHHQTSTPEGVLHRIHLKNIRDAILVEDIASSSIVDICQCIFSTILSRR